MRLFTLITDQEVNDSNEGGHGCGQRGDCFFVNGIWGIVSAWTHLAIGNSRVDGKSREETGMVQCSNATMTLWRRLPVASRGVGG